MTTVTLDHGRDDAKTLLKGCLELTECIDSYTDNGQKLVGKQNASVTGGNGARLTIELPETGRDGETVVTIDAEKEVAVDMATNPDEIEGEFLDQVNHYREMDIDAFLDEVGERMTPAQSKEVDSATQLDGGDGAVAIRFIIIFVLVIVFTLFFSTMMMP